MLVIFDLDGVLVDACEWHRIALNEALKEVGSQEISLADHYGIFNGIPTRVKLAKLTKLGALDESLHQEVYNLKQSKTIEIIEKHANKRLEKIEMLQGLKSEGHTVACFTNSIKITAELMLKRTGIFDMFDKVTTNQDVSAPKPDPEGYVECMRFFNFSPSETLIVEDSPKGIKAAKVSGANVLVVQNPDEVNLALVKKEMRRIKKG